MNDPAASEEQAVTNVLHWKKALRQTFGETSQTVQDSTRCHLYTQWEQFPSGGSRTTCVQRKMSPNTLETHSPWERRPQENSGEKTKWKRGAKDNAGAGQRQEWQSAVTSSARTTPGSRERADKLKTMNSTVQNRVPSSLLHLNSLMFKSGPTYPTQTSAISLS